MQKEYIKSALTGLTVPDVWHKSDSCELLLLRHDNDAGFVFKGKRYGHLIDTLGEDFQLHNVKIGEILLPWSINYGHKNFFYGVSINRSYFAALMKNRLYSLFAGGSHSCQVTKLWKEILECFGPKVIIAIEPTRQLCSAARTMEIPLYELQHGVIANEHKRYGSEFFKDVPDEFLPSGYLCWDEESSEVLSWAEKRGIDVKAIGHPWMLRFIFKKNGDEIVSSMCQEGKIFENSNPTFLYTLQWNLRGLSKIENYTMPEVMKDVILETSSQYNWLIRFHPVAINSDEYEKQLSFLEKNFSSLKNVEWERATVLPLPLVISQSWAHLTWNSSVVLEASWIGIPSGLLDPNLGSGGRYESYYAAERKRGIVHLLPVEKKAIIEWLKQASMWQRSFSTEKMAGLLNNYKKFLHDTVRYING